MSSFPGTISDSLHALRRTAACDLISTPSRRLLTNMDIRFNCPRCGQHLSIEEKGAGMRVGCPNCNEQIEIPRASAVAPPSDAPAAPPALPEFKKCPFCSEEVRLEAIKCKHCGSSLAVPPRPPTHAIAFKCQREDLLLQPVVVGKLFLSRRSSANERRDHIS
jgi:DNA-directed RNA polymerase subunit RPC12/RpoP